MIETWPWWQNCSVFHNGLGKAKQVVGGVLAPLATTCRLSRYDYVVNPAFRYLNMDMCGVDWWSNLVSTSVAPGRQKLFNTWAMSLS